MSIRIGSSAIKFFGAINSGIMNIFRVQHFDASMVYCNVYSRETFLLEHVIFFRNATGIFDSFICDHLFYIAFERATPGFQTSTWIKGSCLISKRDKLSTASTVLSKSCCFSNKLEFNVGNSILSIMYIVNINVSYRK